MSTATIELSSTRRKLFDMLGDSQATYTEQMKNWFRKKCSKEEFDSAARKLLTPDSVHLHNQFLLAILNKCQTLVNITPGPTIAKVDPSPLPSNPDLLSPTKLDGSADRLKKGKIKRKTKPNRPQLEHRFQAVSVSSCSPDVTSSPASLTKEEKGLQFCAREKTMPDISLIHGRLLVAAWEEGLEGVEEEAVAITLAAAEQQLRKIISCLVMSRNSWRERGGLKHSVGVGAPDPWLLNTQTKRRLAGGEEGAGATQASLHNPHCVAPVDREEADRAEAEGMYSSALATQSRHSNPLDLFDLLAALQGDRGVIPSHTVYSTSVERIIMRLHHKT
eukprot:GFUD01026364.1.p1 GENE.GFUD01026364.1~~GFUD01026364.1.p1  ORF type:complete len:333 (+),score=124.74 GFUD01026364.1:44-1042(+)